MLYAQTNQPYPNRIQLVLAPFVGPFVQDGPLGAFDPRRDLQVYVDGALTKVQSFSFDAVNNRYLLFMATTINLQGVIQVIYHVSSPSFVSQSSVIVSTSLVVSPNPVYATRPVVLTATVTSNIGTPTGTVQFYDGATPIGSPQTLVSGAASFTDSSLAIGTHSLFAAYTPSGPPFVVSTSNVVSETINVAPTSLFLAVSPNPTYLTAPVVLTATATSPFGTPTGTVQFYDGVTPIGGPQTLVSGVATYTTGTGSPPLSLSEGVHSLSAVYTPSGLPFVSSISNVVSEDIVVFQTMTVLVVTQI
jgi:Bacterial Ig-like domain (group 3)